PMAGSALIPGSLLREELPGRRIGTKYFLALRCEPASFLFERINAGPVLFTGSKRLESGCCHPAKLFQALHVADVDEAPDAPRPARGKTDFVALLVHLVTHAVDPTVTERFIERLGIRSSLLVGALPVEANP